MALSFKLKLFVLQTAELALMIKTIHSGDASYFNPTLPRPQNSARRQRTENAQLSIPAVLPTTKHAPYLNCRGAARG